MNRTSRLVAVWVVFGVGFSGCQRATPGPSALASGLDLHALVRSLAPREVSWQPRHAHTDVTGVPGRAEVDAELVIEVVGYDHAVWLSELIVNELAHRIDRHNGGIDRNERTQSAGAVNRSLAYTLGKARGNIAVSVIASSSGEDASTLTVSLREVVRP